MASGHDNDDYKAVRDIMDRRAARKAAAKAVMDDDGDDDDSVGKSRGDVYGLCSPKSTKKERQLSQRAERKKAQLHGSSDWEKRALQSNANFEAKKKSVLTTTTTAPSPSSRVFSVPQNGATSLSTDKSLRKASERRKELLREADVLLSGRRSASRKINDESQSNINDNDLITLTYASARRSRKCGEGGRSRLSPTLDDVLHDEMALSYFVQFMEYDDALTYVQFWISVQSYRSLFQTSQSPSQAREDAMSIYNTYISLQATDPVGLDEAIRVQTEDRICCLDGPNEVAFALSETYMFGVMEKEYFGRFTQSCAYHRFVLDVLTSDFATLEDILFNNTALFYFMEFMDRIGGTNLLSFWLAAESFAANWLLEEQRNGEQSGNDAALQQIITVEDTIATVYNVDGGNDSNVLPSVGFRKRMMSDAISLYNRYISLQTVRPLGLEETIRMHVENNMCSEEGPGVDCFALPQALVFEVMEERIFGHFVASDLYKYGLLGIVRSGLRDRQQQQSIRAGDVALSSPDYETVTSNVRNRKVISPLPGVVAPSSLDIPETKNETGTLWQPSDLTGQLFLGQVDAFGTYVRDNADALDNSSNSRGERLMTKLGLREPGQLTKKQAEEARALDEAQRIVSDILGTTVGSGEWDNEDLGDPPVLNLFSFR